MTEVVQENGFTVRNIFADSPKEKGRQEFVQRVGAAMEAFDRNKRTEPSSAEH